MHRSQADLSAFLLVGEPVLVRVHSSGSAAAAVFTVRLLALRAIHLHGEHVRVVELLMAHGGREMAQQPQRHVA